jgi:hypothetical protein
MWKPKTLKERYKEQKEWLQTLSKNEREYIEINVVERLPKYRSKKEYFERIQSLIADPISRNKNTEQSTSFTVRIYDQYSNLVYEFGGYGDTEAFHEYTSTSALEEIKSVIKRGVKIKDVYWDEMGQYSYSDFYLLTIEIHAEF